MGKSTHLIAKVIDRGVCDWSHGLRAQVEGEAFSALDVSFGPDLSARETILQLVEDAAILQVNDRRLFQGRTGKWRVRARALVHEKVFTGFFEREILNGPHIFKTTQRSD